MTTQIRSEETRKRILMTAQRRFARLGYESSSVADICQEAGVSKGAFYYHFPSKHALFLALLQIWLVDLEERMREIQQNRPVPNILMEMSRLIPEVLSAANGQVPVFLEFYTQASRDPATWEAAIAPYPRHEAFFAALIQEGIKEGSIKEINPQSAAQSLIALATGLIIQGLLYPNSADWAQVAQAGVRCLLFGMAKGENPSAAS